MVPAAGLIDGAGDLSLEGLLDVRTDPGDEQVRALPNDLAGDLQDLVGRLAQAVDDLRDAFPELPVVIDLGEIEVLVGVIPEVLEGLFGGQTVFIDLLEDVFETGFHPPF